MAKYRVSWKHEVNQQWVGFVDADSEEEAMEELEAGNFYDEELADEDGISVFDRQVDGLEDEE